ncbi:hypothetical protein ACVQ90_06450 [Staphylococcus aureus]
MKKKGLYDNSVIMIYGDHYGISENHNNAMEKLLGEKITPAKFTDLSRLVSGLKSLVNLVVSIMNMLVKSM